MTQICIAHLNYCHNQPDFLMTDLGLFTINADASFLINNVIVLFKYRFFLYCCFPIVYAILNMKQRKEINAVKKAAIISQERYKVALFLKCELTTSSA